MYPVHPQIGFLQYISLYRDLLSSLDKLSSSPLSYLSLRIKTKLSPVQWQKTDDDNDDNDDDDDDNKDDDDDDDDGDDGDGDSSYEK